MTIYLAFLRAAQQLFTPWRGCNMVTCSLEGQPAVGEQLGSIGRQPCAHVDCMSVLCRRELIVFASKVLISQLFVRHPCWLVHRCHGGRMVWGGCLPNCSWKWTSAQRQERLFTDLPC